MPTNLHRKYLFKYPLSIITILGGYLILYIIDDISGHKYITICPFKLMLGIPCPGCGMGRASLELMKGNFVQSWYYNILCVPFTIAILISLSWLIMDLIRKKETFFIFIKKDFSFKVKILLYGLILIDWTINIIRHI